MVMLERLLPFKRPPAALAPLAWFTGSAAFMLAVVLLITAPHRAFDPSDRFAMDEYRRVQSVIAEERDRYVDEQTKAELALTDPQRTGLVGIEWSPLVSTSGMLSAKQSSAHPAWVALFRRWYRDSALEPGDTIAIGSSGSFPALLVAARVAAESMGLRVRSVISLTASNWGASIPSFDFWAMEEAIQRASLLPPAVLGITPGGDDDGATSQDEADVALLRARFDAIKESATDAVVHWPTSTDDSITFRKVLLFPDDSEPTRLYINLGGHVANYGVGAKALLLPRGLIKPGAGNSGDPRALPAFALSQNIPVINILDVRSILADAGLPSNASPDALPQLEPLPMPFRLSAGLLGATLLLLLVYLSLTNQIVQTTRKDSSP